jgi:hypothetical protein
MRPAVIWTGPVNFSQVPGATVADAHDINIGCFGDRSPNCPAIAASYLDAEGRRIPRLLQAQGLSEDEVGDILFGAFSAGGSLVKRVLLSAQDRARTSVVHLADASYTSEWENSATRTPPPIEGYVLYGLDAIAGPHLFVATASPIPNKTWASGVENLQRLRAEIEARSGRQFTELEHFYGIEPRPDHAYQLGNVILAEYPLQPIGHGHNVLAGQVWEKIVRPWLGTRTLPPIGPPPPGPGPGQPPGAPPHGQLDALGLFVLFLGAAAGFAGVRWLIRRRG